MRIYIINNSQRINNNRISKVSPVQLKFVAIIWGFLFRDQNIIDIIARYLKVNDSTIRTAHVLLILAQPLAPIPEIKP